MTYTIKFGTTKAAISQQLRINGTITNYARSGCGTNVLFAIDPAIPDPHVHVPANPGPPPGVNANAADARHYDSTVKYRNAQIEINKEIDQAVSQLTMAVIQAYEESPLLTNHFGSTLNVHDSTVLEIITALRTFLPVEQYEHDDIDSKLRKPFKADYTSNSPTVLIQVQMKLTEMSEMWTYCADNNFIISDSQKSIQLRAVFFSHPMFEEYARIMIRTNPNATPAVIMRDIKADATFLDGTNWRKKYGPYAAHIATSVEADLTTTNDTDCNDVANAATKVTKRSTKKKKPATNDFYCYTHGPNSSHHGPECKHKANDHNDMATISNKLGGRTDPWVRPTRKNT